MDLDINMYVWVDGWTFGHCITVAMTFLKQRIHETWIFNILQFSLSIAKQPEVSVYNVD